MTRKFHLNKVSIGPASVILQTFVDPWGEDDVILELIDKGDVWELDPMKYWLAMCSLGGANDVVIDCGSYTGLYSLVAADIFKSIRVIAVEASAVTFGRLVSNIYFNGMETRIIPCHNAVFDDREGIALDHQYGTFTMASGESVERVYEADHQEAVPAISLDSLLLPKSAKVRGPIASKVLGLRGENVLAIKIDTEGAEEVILQNGISTLVKWQPYLLVEILSPDKRTRIEKFLFDFGYQLISELPGCNFVYSHSDRVSDLLVKLKQIENSLTNGFRIDRILTLSPGSL